MAGPVGRCTRFPGMVATDALTLRGRVVRSSAGCDGRSTLQGGRVVRSMLARQGWEGPFEVLSGPGAGLTRDLSGGGPWIGTLPCQAEVSGVSRNLYSFSLLARTVALCMQTQPPISVQVAKE